MPHGYGEAQVHGGVLLVKLRPLFVRQWAEDGVAGSHSFALGALDGGSQGFERGLRRGRDGEHGAFQVLGQLEAGGQSALQNPALQERAQQPQAPRRFDLDSLDAVDRGVDGRGQVGQQPVERPIAQHSRVG
jgi:hypothetical protein